MKKLLLFATLLFTAHLASAQFQCGADIMHQKKLQADSNYAKAVQASNDRYIQMMQTNPNGLATTVGYGTKYQIPVVVHVIHTGGAVGSVYNPTDSAIISMIDYLNESYAATYASYPDSSNGGTFFPVEFVLAKRADGCGYTSGINRVNGNSVSNYTLRGINVNNTTGADEATIKALSRWNNHDYYNIWIVNKIDSNDGTFGTYTAGYAYFPGASPTVDGTVMLATTVYAGNITLPHEIGHAFNLYHTFQGDGTGSTCPTNTNCTTDGDLVCDTEPHKRSPFNCPSGTNPCTGNGYNNVQRNFMDYSSCQDRFTAGQKVRWMDALLNDRAGLVSSIATVDTGTNVASNSCSFSTSNVNNNYNLGPALVILNDLSASSNGGYSQDNYQLYLDRTCQQRANVIQGQSYTLSVKTEGPNAQKVAVYIDYDNNGSFSAGELVYSHTGSISGDETHSTTYTVPSSGVTTCTPLRMRVLSEFAGGTLPTNGCGNFNVGGQAEDYSVLVKPASANVTATISGTNPSCTGSSVTFSVTPSATLTSPTYQWYLNSVAVGSNSASYTAPSNVANNSYLVCKINYTGSCGDDSVFSNTLTIQRNGSTVTPSVSLGTNPSSSICSGTSVTFTATPTNGGTTPSYQWKLNGTNVGSNSATYTNASLANSDEVWCVMTSNAACASPTTANSDTVTMTVTPTVTPSVSIAANPGVSICSGTSVTFTATPTNGGTPSYQWKLNGTNVGTNSATYVNASLASSDVVTCVMTSTASCATSSTATSNGLTMTVTPTVTPTITIGANPGNTICSGTSVTFSAVITNGGTTPSYQWKLNGSNVGTNSSAYTNASLSNSDVITCQLTSNASCASPNPVTSSGITMVTTGTLTPSVSIAANTGTTICAGTSVTFTATPTNGGTTPSYQWKVNGTNVGTNSVTYASSTLSNSDVVTCVMTSSLACASPTTGTSNSLTMTVNPTVTPSVSIAANPGNSICAGTSVTFTATPTNGGTTPSYQWKVNGTNVGTNSTTYASSTLSNSDVVTCVMTSNAACPSSATATSNGITMAVTAIVTPTVNVSAAATFCRGSNVLLTATPTNGGTTPSYQWKRNGVNVGTNADTFTFSNVVHTDTVICVMTSNHVCAATATATSNIITMDPFNDTIDVGYSFSLLNPICPNDSVLFSAVNVLNDNHNSKNYRWKINGVDFGDSTNIFTHRGWSVGDTVTCIHYSLSACANPVIDSVRIPMNVSSTTTIPSATVAVSPNDSICAGASVTFTVTPTNGGTAPHYQWKLNGSDVGSNSATYNVSTLADGDIVSCAMASNATCPTVDTVMSDSVTMYVTPNVTPSVSIAANPGNTICAGTSVMFTATPTNGGTTPSYQWKVNGINVGANSATYTSAALSNSDVVSCVLTSSETCVTSSTATSNNITISVTTTIVPTIAITNVNPNDTICAGTSVMFTATGTNGGTTPTYQWKVNGTNVGTNSTSYTSASLLDADVVTCTYTSSATCAVPTSVTSSGVTMKVNPNLTPAIAISVSPNDTVCSGTTVTFTATPTNGGTTPSYQWKRNGSNVGTNSSMLTLITPNDGDVITCVLTSSETCVTSSTATSNSITLEVKPNLTPTVAISVSPNDTICAGNTVTFTAVGTNGGSTPSYQWKVNGTNVGTNSTTYTSSTLSNSDIVTCVMTSSEMCVTSPTATSNSITMTVNPLLTPLITISVSPNDTICDGTTVTFSSSITNGGAAPAYQWLKNNTTISGATSSTYTTSTLADGDVITCRLTSSETCVTTAIVTSAGITMEVIPNVTPSVSITVAPKDTVCDGSLANFTAIPVNSGTSATYQWKLNGTNVGSNSFFYSNNTLSNNDVVSCIMTSSLACVTKQADTSNNIAMTVLPLTSPTVSISSSVGSSTCKDGTVTFTSSFMNGGTSQSYQWKLNNVNISGATGATYTTTTLNNSDKVFVEMTITADCPAPATVQSDTITMTVMNPSFTVSVSPDDTICSNTPAMFSITPTDAGGNPQYQWYRNNQIMNGVTSNVFTVLAPNNGDAVTATFTGSDNCVNAPIELDTVKIGVIQNITPVVAITASPSNSVPPSVYVTFKALTNARNPQYQWRKNGVDIAGANSDQYTTNALVTNDSITVLVTTLDSCASIDSALSNAIQMLVGVGVKEVETRLFDDVTLAPNPNNGSFVIKGKLMTSIRTDEVEVDVINSVGQIVHRGKIPVDNGQFSYHIDLGEKAHDGLHMVRLHLNGRVHYLKFITTK